MDAPPAPAIVEPPPEQEFVRREELARALVEMLDDEIRALKMRIGVLEARRKRIMRQLSTSV